MRWTCYIFDLDGTLTLAQHDFAGFKRQVGLPLELSILEGIATKPPAQHAALHEAVHDWEQSLAAHALAAPDAVVLLEALATAQVPRAVLTRNTRETALLTLQSSGLLPYFDPDHVLGRHCAAPKPAPDGVLRCLELLQHGPAGALMVGDHIDDVRAGEAAGTEARLLLRGGTADARTVTRLDLLWPGLI